jgi:hypothetical protein
VLKYLLLAILNATLAAATIEVQLQSPLNTLARCPAPVGDGVKVVTAVVDVPADAPPDLGVGAFLTDQHGHWFQSSDTQRLTPGSHHLSFRVSPSDLLISEPDRAAWSSAANAVVKSGGLFFWSQHPSRARITCTSLAIKDQGPAKTAGDCTLVDVAMTGFKAEGIRVRAGERWSLTLRPHPFPENPYDSEQFTLDALITDPDGKQLAVPGFFLQPMEHFDRGDREEIVPTAASHFEIRFRPRKPGVYAIKVQGRWRERSGKKRSVSFACPSLTAEGPAWDDFVRVDAHDPRFFSANGAFYWPIGFNLRSVVDVRTKKYLLTELTPNRGSISYEAYLRRLAAAGGNAVEIWMSSWNLALEWRDDWPGYHGQGRYHEANAWRLDRILDLCSELGIRVNLVINNHGQGSTTTDEEWDNNPHGVRRGGKLTDASDLFQDPWALASQERQRRYIVARYGDHPSVMAWKLWSEINLTAGGHLLRPWHDQASKRWHALDIYQHPVTTHWSGDYRAVDQNIVALPGIDFTCMDAYHGSGDRRGGSSLAELLADGVKRIGRHGKPVLVTEYGGHWDAGPEPQILAEHMSGGWIALVTGNGGHPLLWWSEWVDQKNLWHPYLAVSRYLKKEDLRGGGFESKVLQTIDATVPLWARAWSRPGRMLGYLMDSAWADSGGDSPEQTITKINIGAGVAAGAINVEWWNADDGEVLNTVLIQHPGGQFTITAPHFRRHIAFKMYRPTPPTNPPVTAPPEDQ